MKDFMTGLFVLVLAGITAAGFVVAFSIANGAPQGIQDGQCFQATDEYIISHGSNTVQQIRDAGIYGQVDHQDHQYVYVYVFQLNTMPARTILPHAAFVKDFEVIDCPSPDKPLGEAQKT